MNVNQPGIIYYGTNIKHLTDIDQNGLYKPRHRKEQFISVSISGYEATHELAHPELVETGRVFAEHIGNATLNGKRLVYKPGYHNSFTYLEGFGPNPSKYLRCIFGLIHNKRTENTMTVVLEPAAKKYLVEPDRENTFEYFSMAIHGFISCVDPELIAGWIVPEQEYDRVVHMMDSGEIQKRQI